MITEVQYTNIKRVLDDLMDHPMLRDLTLEQVVRYTLRFISLNGFPALYKDKVATINIEDFRGVLPCDIISIVQVKDKHTGIAMRAMTDTFYPHEKEHKQRCRTDLTNNVVSRYEKAPHAGGLLHIADPLPEKRDLNLYQYMRPKERTFKTQGRIIYTSFPHGEIEIVYKAIPVDEDGYPLLIDNETYLAALEAYIKKQVFTIKYDLGKISIAVLQNAQQEYAWQVGMLDAEMNIPSMSEMEAITRMWNTLIPQVRHFDSTFKELGSREYIRNHK